MIGSIPAIILFSGQVSAHGHIFLFCFFAESSHLLGSLSFNGRIFKYHATLSTLSSYCSTFGCRTTKIATSNDWNGITSKKPGTILSMQNVELGQTKVMQIRQRETLNHQGAITHEVCCLAAQYFNFSFNLFLSNCWLLVFCLLQGLAVKSRFSTFFSQRISVNLEFSFSIPSLFQTWNSAFQILVQTWYSAFQIQVYLNSRSETNLELRSWIPGLL